MHLRWFRVTALALLALALAGAGVWLGPSLLVGPRIGELAVHEQLAALAAVRGQCIQLVGVLGGLITVSYGIRKHFLDKEKQRLDADKHVTDRFSGAVGHLGSEDETVRAGGVRTLDRIMGESPRDHEWVVDTLAGLLRHRAVRPEDADSRRRLPDDVQAAVTALRNRPSRPESAALDLTEVYLPGVRLTNAKLANANLAKADLSGAHLGKADLTAADLSGATLTAAVLSGIDAKRARLREAALAGVDLTDADLTGADLSRARLSGATLTRTRLSGADLTGADLRGVDLSSVTGLTEESISRAVT